MPENKEVLLSVKDMSICFGKGKHLFKAVNNVSFDIYKGEVFGLVGESGCGKTTTGRSIIKLYDITSGNVYFKGQRIGAGTRSYTDAIAKARTDASKKIKALRAEKDVDATRKAEIQAEIKKINERNVSYKFISRVKIRTEEFPKNTSRKITRFAIDKSID